MRYFPSRLAALAALALLVNSVSSTEDVPPAPAKATPAVTPTAAKSLRFSSPIVQAVRKTRDSIVTIRIPRPNGGKDLIGTGVIFDERGLIVTNRHVVGNNKRVPVRLYDGTELYGDVQFAETRWDLAVVKIHPKRQLAALAFAKVDDLEVGETVIAIGHPYGYMNTVSTGIVSALNREITMPSGDTITGLIQTDTAINPGNSGGPLLNVDGEFIGINVALREGAQNIAFAINAGMVKAVVGRHFDAQRVGGVEYTLQNAERNLGTQAAQITVGAGVGVPATK